LDYKVEISEDARDDFIAYAAFIVENEKSEVPAKKWVNGLFAAAASLSTFPSRFRVVPEADLLDFPYRSFIYHSHRVIFRIDEDQSLVSIVRIYHGALPPLTSSDVPPLTSEE
jgi:plasmid stabilization system protein ParE